MAKYVVSTSIDASTGRKVPIIGLTSDNEAEVLKDMVWEKLKENSLSDWWMDTGASHHFCLYKELFATYEEVDDRKIMSGNVTQSIALGIGNVDIKMTSGKTMTLVDVLHVSDMRKNLVSWSKLSMRGYAMFSEYEWMELYKDQEYVGICHLDKNMFRLNSIP